MWALFDLSPEGMQRLGFYVANCVCGPGIGHNNPQGLTPR